MNGLIKRFFTPDEYLDLEVKAEYRSQYVGGEIFAMDGSQPWHNTVTGNLLVALRMGSRRRRCKAYAIAQRVQVEAGGLYTYPDVIVPCETP